MLIDFHTHVGKDRVDAYQTFNELIKSMGKHAISKSVVFPFDSSDIVCDSVEILRRSESDDRIIPFLRFNPSDMDAERLNGLIGLGFKGVKLHCRSQDFFPNDPSLDWMYETIQQAGLPLIFHCAEKDEKSKARFILKVARRFPNLKVIIGHFFGDDFSLWKKFSEIPNIYTETSVYLRSYKLKYFVERYGADRIMFGSDTPYDSIPAVIQKIKDCGFPKDIEDAIFYRNAQKILKI